MRLVFFLLLVPLQAFALQDPTGGKPFLPWIWQDQFKPTLTHSLDLNGIGVLAGGTVATILSHQYDGEVADQMHTENRALLKPETSSFLSTLGGGGLGAGIALVQLFVDQKNGLKTGRAIALTSVTQISLAFIAQRERPYGRADYLGFKSSWPSGHSSNAFATAEVLAYEYGWWVGVPMNALAIAIAAGRVSENDHWLSDVVAGAALGIFWAHASDNVDKLQPETAWQWSPVPLDQGLALQVSRRF